MPLTVAEFVHRWKRFSQTEDAGSQSHFLDLCDMLGEQHPAAADVIVECRSNKVRAKQVPLPFYKRPK